MSLKITCTNRFNPSRSYTVIVPENGVVQDIRISLQHVCLAKLDSILLFDGDEYLQNFVPLTDYGISDNAVLIYESRLCGPLPVNYDWSKSGLKTKYSRFTIQNNAGKN